MNERIEHFHNLRATSSAFTDQQEILSLLSQRGDTRLCQTGSLFAPPQR